MSLWKSLCYEHIEDKRNDLLSIDNEKNTLTKINLHWFIFFKINHWNELDFPKFFHIPRKWNDIQKRVLEIEDNVIKFWL